MNEPFFVEELRRSFERVTDKKTAATFPGEHVRFSGDIDHAVVTMEPQAVAANMQSNVAAFEAWALVLKCWCNVRSVSLRREGTAPASTKGRKHNGHYQRFLWRVGTFKDLFPEWFSYDDPAEMNAAHCLTSKSLALNVAGDRPKRNESERADVLSPQKAEAALEYGLCGSKEFVKFFNLTSVDRQFPVGVFDGSPPTDKNRVFTGGKSAIDIIAKSEKALWLFELKAGKNVAMGALSELLLYVSLMRAARNQRVAFAIPEKSRACMGVSPDDVKNCSNINAVILAEKIHPLLAYGNLIDVLNDAIAVRWTATDNLPVRFGAAEVSQEGPDYKFTRLAGV